MKNMIHHGDCLEVMKLIPDGSVDMILCDLPYGTTQNKWDTIIPFEPLWEQYKRIIKSNGAIVLTAAQPFTSSLVMSNPKMFRYDLIWYKVNSTGFLNANRCPLRTHESALVFYKKLPVFNPQMTIGKMKDKGRRTGKVSDNYGSYKLTDKKETDLYFPESVVSFSTGNNNKSDKHHPTQKPVALFEYLIKTYTNEGDTILDNCAGSGTTGIACQNTNRNYILIEQEQKYFDIIEQRLGLNNIFQHNLNF